MKKVTAILLTLIMAIGFAIPTFATDAQITADIVGYSDARVVAKEGLDSLPGITELIGGNSENKTEFKISTPLELKAFTLYDGTCSGITIYLANDIDMSEMTGMSAFGGGSAEAATKPFRGSFDGQGYTIDNLVIDGGENQHVGLFANLQGATVKNIVFGAGCKFSGKNRVGAVAGGITGDINKNSTIDNCMNKGEVSGSGAFIGGIVGYAAATGVNCWNEAGQKATQAEFDAAIAANIFTITNCTNTGAVTAATRDVGGIVGAGCVRMNIANCRNTGAVEAKATDKNTRGTGGIIGRAYVNTATEASTITGCINNGSVKADKFYAGGIIGTVDSHKVNITNCKNFGAISTGSAAAEGTAAGICAYAVQSGNVTESGNEGTTAAATDATLEVALLADTLISKAAVSTGGNTTNNETNNNNNKTENKNDDGDTDTEAENTAADDTAADTDEEKSGCGASVTAGIAIVTMLAGAGAVVCKKRK
ncbi:MAG: hypothetical protein IJZ83_01945 [Clostridia bacterium]|nr:hypothetical protein [Clostridia bacterium]